MNQLTIAQQLRASVKLTKPELLAEVPSDYDARQTFNFLRHKATNYDQLISQHTAKYGDLTRAEAKALTQGAADVILAAFRSENDDLLKGKANTVFAQFIRRLVKTLGLSDGLDLETIYKETKTLKRSQVMYKSWNERYRRQRELVLYLTKQKDPDLYAQISEIYKANSDASLTEIEQLIYKNSNSSRQSKAKSLSTEEKLNG